MGTTEETAWLAAVWLLGLAEACSMLHSLRPCSVYSECLDCDLNNSLYPAQAKAAIYLMSRKHVFRTRLLR